VHIGPHGADHHVRGPTAADVHHRNVPHAVGADEVTDCQSQSYKGWGTVHAMRADGDTVIDVRVTGERLNDQAVRVVNAIVDHGRI
jgi:hypothetical protein